MVLDPPGLIFEHLKISRNLIQLISKIFAIFQTLEK